MYNTIDSGAIGLVENTIGGHGFGYTIILEGKALLIQRENIRKKTSTLRTHQ